MVSNEMSLKEILNDFDENYSKIRKLIDEDSKNDPENDPYSSKYKAKTILVGMHEKLKNLMGTDITMCELKMRAMLGSVLLNIGCIETDTEELAASEKTLSEAVLLLEPNGNSPEIIITLVSVYNSLGILWFNRDEPKKSETFLMKAKELYDTFKLTTQLPFPIEHVVKELDEKLMGDNTQLEKAYTLTLYYLAQVYGSLGENLKSAIYCHRTLRRQLAFNDYDPIDWALNSATLAQVFAEQDGFMQARHHLAAASTVMEKYEQELRGSENNDEAHLAKIETLNHRSADVARCWAKYCILLMSTSKERLMYDDDLPFESAKGFSKLSLDGNIAIDGIDVTKLFFTDTDVSKYENQIGCKYLLTYQDAREVFLCCQTWLSKAKEYYKLDTLASDYIQIIQDSSQSYTYLAFFEEDDDRRAKMHKRRIDMLEELLKQVNPVYYLQYCRQIWFELGEAYSDILNIKLDKQSKIKGHPVPQTLKKINMLCEKSIENYKAFLDSVKDKEGKMPTSLPEDLIKPVVTIYALIGRNSMKRIPVNKQMHLQHVQEGLDSYQAVVDICSTSEVAATIMNQELQLCQEMVNILPLKIQKLKQALIE